MPVGRPPLTPEERLKREAARQKRWLQKNSKIRDAVDAALQAKTLTEAKRILRAAVTWKPEDPKSE
jgi:hypothetical protein